VSSALAGARDLPQMRQKARGWFPVDREAEFTLVVSYGVAGLVSDGTVRRAGIKPQLVQQGLDSADLVSAD
jgi:hypothetical protein